MSKISIASDDRVFVLTGAGISAESGLPTFRASDGLWAGNRVEDVCTPEAWERNPWRGLGVLRGAARGGRKGRAESGARGAGRVGSAARRPLLSLHAECGRPARAGRLEAAGAHARRTEQGALRARVRPAAGRGSRHLSQPRRGWPLRLRRRACVRTSSSSARFRWRWIAFSRRSRRQR